MFNKETSLARWFYAFISIHLLFWTLVPAVIRLNLPLDAIEGTIWGHQLEWGYDKNPFLNGWLTALATFLTGHSGWGVYLFSQLSVVAAFYAAWRIAKQMLPPVYALASVLLLEGIQYYNFHAIDFNDNTLELGLWALAMLAFYDALKTKRTLPWLLTGMWLGLGMMAKYYTLALLAGMGLFLLFNSENRKQLATLPPYLGLLIFISIILPHIAWLFSHEFVTVKYVFARAGSPPSWTNHLFFPAQFAWQQFEAFLPAIVLASLLFLGKKPSQPSHPFGMAAFDRGFLLFIGMGPFLLTLLLAFGLGIKLRAGWGMPLMSLWGIILIAFLKPALTETKIKRFYAFIYAFMSLSLMGYTLSLVQSSDTSTANFPGRAIAQTITHAWHERYHTPLRYVAGSRWVGGNIGFYSKDHPAVYIEWNKTRAPWIDEKQLRENGAVFVWDITGHETLPNDIQTAFPNLTKPMILMFDWHRNVHGLPPERIGVAFLPPSFLMK